MHRPTSDPSHLYHDSHFTGLSGAALEAREHLKAREENAREQRLLRKHDQHLQQAKAVCRRRSQWEQASVRKDLQAILQRTPTFHRILQDEKKKLHEARQSSYLYGGTGRFSPPPHKEGHAGWQSTHAVGQHGGTMVPGGGKGRRRRSRRSVSVPSKPSTHTRPASLKEEPSSPVAKKRLPPLSAAESTGVGVGKGPNRDGPAPPKRCPHPASSPGMTATDATAGSACKQLSKPEVRGKKYTPPSLLLLAGTPKMKQQGKPADLSPSPSPDQDVTPSPSIADAGNLGPGQRQSRAATDLRRRSHHAVMTIVHVQARHERRVREADAAMARAAISRRYRFSDQPSSQSLALMSRLLSKRIGGGRAAASSDDSKLGWRSLPVEGAPRRASDTDSSPLLVPVPVHSNGGEVCGKRVRPRFYSLE